MLVRFLVPGKIHAWQRSGQSGKRHFVDRAELKYRSDIGYLCKDAMRKAGVRMLTGPVMLHVRAVFPRKAATPDTEIWHTDTPDLDNIIKLVKDALKGIAWRDDRQVCRYRDPEKVYGAGPKSAAGSSGHGDGLEIEIVAL
jgi:Holliday junction resolvase RusA-like endonuclease